MNIKQYVAGLHPAVIRRYAELGPDGAQFEFARDLCLEADAPCGDNPNMDHYEAMEIALDELAIMMELM